jgi:ecotin
MKTLLALALLALASSPAQAAGELKAFPPPDAGMKRYVIDLPQLDDEDAAKVQLIVGKTVSVDERNRHFFVGTLAKETIKGWGFDRYILRKLGPMGGTLIAVDPTAPKVKGFVALGGGPQLFRYNSKLPIVVYVPDGVEVRYRIWRADAATTNAERG